MNGEIFIPITMFVGMFIVIGIFVVLRYRAKAEQQATIRAVIDKGHELSPELIRQIGSPAPPAKDRDLRRGVVSLAIAGAIAVFALAIQEEDALGPLLGLAAFPTFIGIAFIAMHYLGSKDAGDA
jgi:hypothetical protein